MSTQSYLSHAIKAHRKHIASLDIVHQMQNLSLDNPEMYDVSYKVFDY